MTQRFGNNTVSRGPQPAPAPAPAPLARAFIVGRTERGPAGVPTRIRDFDEFKATFGTGSDDNGTAELATLANDYFRAVGTNADAIVLRLFEGGIVANTAKSPGADEPLTARATGPGSFGNNIECAFVVRPGPPAQAAVVTVYVREMKNGIVVSSRTSPTVSLDAAGIAQANTYLAGLVVLEFNPLATAALSFATQEGKPLTWVNLSGGVDSAAPTVETLKGTVNPDTQVRTGLELLKDSKYGGGVLIAPGFEDDEGRATKYAWAASTFRFIPDGPGSDLLISGGIADFQAARLIPGAEYSAYWFGRPRSQVGGQYVTRSSLGGVGGLLVNAIMARPGYIAPPAGDTVFTDLQHSPDGSAALVTDANMTTLLTQGMNVLVARTRVQAQGLALAIGDPLQPATTKLHHRLLSNTLAYDLGPALAQFDNSYVDAQGAFYSTVEAELKNRLKPYHDSGVLYGLSLADAAQIKFTFLQSPDEVLEQTGRVAVNVLYKVSGVSEGIDLSLGQVTINTVF